MKRRKMSVAQKAKYKDEWVLLADYDLDDRNEPLAGVVVAHSKDREEIYGWQMGIKYDSNLICQGGDTTATWVLKVLSFQPCLSRQS